MNFKKSKKEITGTKTQLPQEEAAVFVDEEPSEEIIVPEIVEEDRAVDFSEAHLSGTLPVVQSLVEGPEDIAGAIVPQDSLQRYLAEIRGIPSLSREEEHELALKYFKKKDQKAGYQLVLANLRLVVMVAREYQKNVHNVLDLVQEGNIGLLEAVKQYDPFRGIRFSSYAVYWVRAYMLRYIINNLRLVKIGTTQAQRKLFFNLQKEKDKLEAEGFSPEAKLLAKRLNVKESEVIEMEQRLGLPEFSVDAKVGGDEDSSDFHGFLADNKENAEDIIVREQFSGSIRKAVDKFKEKLSDKEKAIIDLRLMTEDPITLQEIADRFQLSRERIRQLETRLKEQLKEVLSRELDLGEEGVVDIES